MQRSAIVLTGPAPGTTILAAFGMRAVRPWMNESLRLSSALIIALAVLLGLAVAWAGRGGQRRAALTAAAGLIALIGFGLLAMIAAPMLAVIALGFASWKARPRS